MKKRWIALIILLSGAFLCAVSYAFWDIPLAFFCLYMNPAILAMADVVTQAGDSVWYYIVLVPAFVLLRFVAKNELWSSRILFVFLSLSVSGILSTGLKWFTGRHRPVNLIEDGQFGFTFFQLDFIYESTSFPSGHAVTAFALATAFAFIFPRWRAAAFVVAGLIAASRVLLTAHFLSDVIAGATVGSLCALGVKYWFDRLHVDLQESV